MEAHCAIAGLGVQSCVTEGQLCENAADGSKHKTSLSHSRVHSRILCVAYEGLFFFFFPTWYTFDRGNLG